jgi:phosphate transport system substrate-binding protein
VKKSARARLPIFITLLFISFACERRPSVILAGSTAFQPFAEKLAEDFMDTRSKANVTVQGGGSAVGINAALSGTAQIGMADLVTLPPEAKDLTATVVARDGIAIVANPANKATNLTMEQIRGVFSGLIKNWREVGGDDAPITVVSRESGSGTRSSFEKIAKVLSLTKDAVIQDSNGTIRETVANDANAIGYLSQGMVSEKIKALSVDGIAPTINSVISGKYPLVRPIYFLTKGEVSGAAKEFLDYVLSDIGQKTIQENGLIPAR